MVVKKGCEKKKYIVYFLCGMLGLSSLTNDILSYLHIGFYLFEIFLIPILFLERKKLKGIFSLRISIGTFAVLALTLASIVIGIVNTGDIFNVVTCARPLIYLVLLIYYLPRITTKQQALTRDTSEYQLYFVKKLWVLALGVLIGEAIHILLNADTLERKGAMHINIFAIAYCILIPFVVKNRMMTILGTVSALFLAFMSGYRINILIAILSLCMGILYTYKEMNWIKKILFLCIVVFIAGFVINNFVDILVRISEYLNLPASAVYRLVERSEGLFTGNLSLSDKNRLSKYFEYLSEFIYYVIPTGPVGKAVSLEAFGRYTDVPISFLGDVFGCVITVVIVSYMFIGGVKAWIGALSKEKDIIRIASGLCFPIVFTLFVINGTFLTFAHISVLSAVMLAYWNKESFSRFAQRGTTDTP